MCTNNRRKNYFGEIKVKTREHDGCHLWSRNYLLFRSTCVHPRFLMELVLLDRVYHCLSFFFWPLYCLFFFDVRFWLPLWYLQTFLTNNSSKCWYLGMTTDGCWPIPTISMMLFTSKSVGTWAWLRTDVDLALRLVWCYSLVSQLVLGHDYGRMLT